jgi:formate dehydrogenase iron-sulfur subunit
LGAAFLRAKQAAPARASRAHDNGMAMLYDSTKCIGCRACQNACKEWNRNPPEAGADLSADTWTLIQVAKPEGSDEWAFLKRQCMHCLHPACVSACPVGALQQTEQGAVVYDPDRCIGCRYCMVACPFGVPKLEWEETLPYIRKCTFCVDRLKDGLEPACAAACPVGALVFGERESLVAEAENRIRSNPDKYVNHIYGKEELGGTSMLYLSHIPFEELGLPTLGSEPVTRLSEVVATYGTPSVALSVATLLGGLYYWFTRREKSIEAEEVIRQEEGEMET